MADDTPVTSRKRLVAGKTVLKSFRLGTAKHPHETVDDDGEEEDNIFCMPVTAGHEFIDLTADDDGEEEREEEVEEKVPAARRRRRQEKARGKEALPIDSVQCVCWMPAPAVWAVLLLQESELCDVLCLPTLHYQPQGYDPTKPPQRCKKRS